MFDRLLSAIRINDDYDDDEFYDDEIDSELYDELENEKPLKERKSEKNAFKGNAKGSSRFSRKMEDVDLEDEPVKEKKKRFGKEKAPKASKADKYDAPSYTSRSSKITPIRKHRGDVVMEVRVIKPTSIEENQEIADTLREGCTVVLNLEGVDFEISQRIVDFTLGASYALDGTFHVISGYIYIITPNGVEISGDIQELLSEASSNLRIDY